MNNGCGMSAPCTFQKGSLPSSSEQAKDTAAATLGVTDEYVHCGGSPSHAEGKIPNRPFSFSLFLKSHHMIPSLRYQISCCYEEQDRILFRSGKITNMANSGSWKESGDGDLTLLTVVQLIWMFMPHYLLSKKEK